MNALNIQHPNFITLDWVDKSRSYSVLMGVSGRPHLDNVSLTAALVGALLHNAISTVAIDLPLRINP